MCICQILKLSMYVIYIYKELHLYYTLKNTKKKISS